jgi:hypothetical protein
MNDHHSNLHAAYWKAIANQRLNRGLGDLTPTEQKVATAVFKAGICALGDNVADVPRYRVVPAPTGTGKSSFSFAFITALVETDPDASVLFLVETARQADATYEQLVPLIEEDNVAVWTGAHDLNTPDHYILRDFGFISEHRFSQDELKDYRVVVATHQFYKGVNARKATVYGDTPRNLTFVDERPKDVNTFDIGTGDIANARDMVAAKFGADCKAVQELLALQTTLETIWTSASKSVRFDSVPAMGCEWFNTIEAAGIEKAVAGDDGQDSVRKSFGFGRAMAMGFSFSARIKPDSEDTVSEDKSINGARFVGYELKMPLVSGPLF